MKIAVTGGSGAIGQIVCDELTGSGHQVVSLDRAPSPTEVEFRQVDLTSLEATRQALKGCDQVVHLAAIPDPFGGDSLEEVIGNNTVSSYVVFEAARLEQIPRVVYGCSESSTGFGIHHVKLLPEYLPIDEEHPLWPHESYSLSKHIGERIGANYAKAFGMEVISLRYVWVWSRRCEDAAREISRRAREGIRPDEINGFGCYIAVRDVARACAASVAYQFPDDGSVPFEAFFLAAADTFLPVPTLEVVQANYGKLPLVRDPEYFEADPCISVFDLRKARRLLGWEPAFGWRDIDEMEF
ncbi:NAD-dependent epimerase/dehydratase family protein [Candidatus Latescibacterota bacterium]